MYPHLPCSATVNTGSVMNLLLRTPDLLPCHFLMRFTLTSTQVQGLTQYKWLLKPTSDKENSSQCGGLVRFCLSGRKVASDVVSGSTAFLSVLSTIICVVNFTRLSAVIASAL